MEIDQALLDKWTDMARRDDWHRTFVGSDIRMMLGEIGRLRKQCEGLANSALKNGQGLVLYERALNKIKDLSDSEDGEPLDDAIRIAEQALAFQAPQLNLGAPR